MLVVALDVNARLGQSNNPAENLEFSVVVVTPSRDLNLQFILLRHVVAEPLELVAVTGHEEVVDIGNCPQAAHGLSEDTLGDLALIEPQLLLVTLDYNQPCEWGVTGTVQCPDKLTNKSPPWDSAPGSSMYTLREQYP